MKNSIVKPGTNLHTARYARLCVLIISCFIFTTQVLAGADDLYKEANALYLKQQYNQAIEKYETAVKQNGASFELYFNLGNAYYKSGNFTQAILNYERAKKIKPFDDDLAMNIALANQNTIDKIEPTPQVFYQQWWDNYLSGSTPDNRAWLAIAAVWIAFAIGCVYILSRKYSIKKISFVAMFMFSAIGLFFWYVASRQYSINTSSLEALIVSQSTFVKSSPDDKGTNLFQLHSGTKINVSEELGEWRKIKIPNGNEGWVRAVDLEAI